MALNNKVIGSDFFIKKKKSIFPSFKKKKPVDKIAVFKMLNYHGHTCKYI